MKWLYGFWAFCCFIWFGAAAGQRDYIGVTLTLTVGLMCVGGIYYELRRGTDGS